MIRLLRPLSNPEVLMLALGTAMILMGLAEVFANDVPPQMLCVGPNKNGCAALPCPGNAGQCNSTNYHRSERATFLYRTCTGQAGNCNGWSPSYITCQNYFYNNVGCTDNPTPCTLTSTISACKP